MALWSIVSLSKRMTLLCLVFLQKNWLQNVLQDGHRCLHLKKVTLRSKFYQVYFFLKLDHFLRTFCKKCVWPIAKQPIISNDICIGLLLYIFELCCSFRSLSLIKKRYLGKMVCTGAKSEEDSRLAARKYARIVQKLGFPTKFKDFKIQNMVINFDRLMFPFTDREVILTDH